MYNAEDIDIDDPQENPFHENRKALPVVLQGMFERTREAQHMATNTCP